MKKLYIALLIFLPVIMHSADYTPYQSTEKNKRRRLGGVGLDEHIPRKLNSPCESSSDEDSILCFSDPEDDTPCRSSSDEEDIICIPHSSDDDSTEDEGLDIEIFPQVASSRGSKSTSNSTIDKNLQLANFITAQVTGEKRLSAAKIAEAWNEKNPNQNISQSAVGKWMTKKGLKTGRLHIIDGNPDLEKFIRQTSEEQPTWGATKIAKAWEAQGTDPKIDVSIIRRWIKKKEGSTTQQEVFRIIDGNPDLANFITAQATGEKRLSAAKIAEAWNEKNPNQNISQSAVGKWMTKKGLKTGRLHIIDGNPDLEKFIRQTSEEQPTWGATKIAKAWEAQGTDPKIDVSTIRCWIKKKKL